MPVIFRLWQEPNGPHNPYYGAWQGGLGTGGEAAFAAAWRHIWMVFKNAEKATLAAGGNCIWVFCAQADNHRRRPAARGSRTGRVAMLSTGAVWTCTVRHSRSRPSTRRSMALYQWAVDHQKPFMICESRFQQGKVVTDSSGRYDKDGSVTGNSLITSTRMAVKQYPQCVAYGIWNNGRGNLADFVDTSAASLAQYRAFAATHGSPSGGREHASV